MHKTVKGIFWINGVMLSNAFLWVLVIETSSGLSPFQTVFFSNLFALLMLLPWVFKHGVKKALVTQKTKLYCLRSVVEVLAFSSLFYAIPKVALSTSTALQFLSPLLSVTIVVLFLGEKARSYTWFTLAIGLLGVLLIARPDSDSFGVGEMFCIISALFFSTAPAIVSRLVTTEPSPRVAFYFCLLTSLFSLPLALMNWIPLSSDILLMCVVMGVFSLFSQLGIGQALANAKVTIVMPFFFMNLVFSTILAAIIYGQPIALLTIFGGALILASAVYATVKSLDKGDSLDKTPKKKEPPQASA